MVSTWAQDRPWSFQLLPTTQQLVIPAVSSPSWSGSTLCQGLIQLQKRVMPHPALQGLA